MVTKRKPVKRKKTVSARVPGHPVSAVQDAQQKANGQSVDNHSVDVSSNAAASANTAPANTAATTVGASQDVAKKQPNKKPQVIRKKRFSPKVHAALIAVAAVLVAIITVVGVFSWDRWFRYDDTLDFVGEWQIHNSETTIVIDGERMMLASDAVFHYTLDTTTKTIHFTLGTMEGGGRYRFSTDRNQLVIEDGQYGSWLANAWHDAGWKFNQLMYLVFGAPLQDPAGDGMSVLNRAGVPSEFTQTPESAEETQEETSDNADETTDEDTALDNTDSPDQASQNDVELAESADKQSDETHDNASNTAEKQQDGQPGTTAGGNAVTLEDLQGAV